MSLQATTTKHNLTASVLNNHTQKIRAKNDKNNFRPTEYPDQEDIACKLEEDNNSEDLEYKKYASESNSGAERYDRHRNAIISYISNERSLEYVTTKYHISVPKLRELVMVVKPEAWRHKTPNGKSHNQKIREDTAKLLKKDLSELKGKYIELHFYLNNSKIFGYRYI